MKRPVLIALTLALAIPAAFASDPAVDAARIERARKEKLRQRAAVVGNEELGAASGDAILGHAGPSNGVVVGRVLAEPEPPDVGRAADLLEESLLSEAEDELAWRERMADARARIVELKADLEYARQKLLIYRLGLIVPTDPVAERNRKTDIDALMANVAALERALAVARLEPARIQDEARRSRVMPGWVR